MNQIGVLCFLIGLGTAMAIQCYVHPETPMSTESGRVTDCASTEDRCIKVIKIIGGEKPQFTRQCGTSSRNNCETINDANAKIETCYCDQNHCNAAGTRTFSVTLAIIMYSVLAKLA